MKNITIDELREGLHSDSAFEFEFVKKDGTIRDAVGTLNDSLIPTEHKLIDDPSTGPINTGGTLRYFDLEKTAWRAVGKDQTTVKIK